MKRLRSSDDLDDMNSNRPSSQHRSFHYKPENTRKGLSTSSSRYDRTVDEDREISRPVRKRSEYDFEGFDRRKGFDRFRDGGGDRGGFLSSSPRGAFGDDRIHRSESFSGPRREFPKGFRSERDRSRREGSVSSWRRFGASKDFDDSGRSGSDLGRKSRERGTGRSPKGLRDVNLKSPTWSKESGSEQSKRRSPKGFRDGKLKSPTWSKESGSEQSKMRSPKGVRDEKSKSPTCSKDSGSEQSRMRSPRGLRDAKSPPWSKDSGSEQSKSFDVKKNDESQVESDSSSEMEEGELEPEPEAESDPAPDPGPEAEVQAHVELTSDHKEVECDQRNEDADAIMGDAEKSPSEETLEPNKESIYEQKDAEKEVDELPDNQKNLICSIREASGSEDDNRTTSDHDVGRNEQCLGESGDYRDFEDESSKLSLVEKSSPLRDKQKEDREIDLEVKGEDIDLTEPNEEVTEENGAPEVNLAYAKEGINQDYKDKGKSVAVSSTHFADSAENDAWIERGSRDHLTCKDNSMEGPSTRGFELFSSSPIKRPDRTDTSAVDKHRNEKLTLEPLDLSLSLPNVLLPIGSHDVVQAPSSPSQTRSFQSLNNTFCTNSDGFTASMSFSGSQTFMHNPSCSLTQNSFDNFEQSVGSHPIFQGVDQVSLKDSKHKEVPLYQRLLMNGHGSLHQSHALSGMSNGQDAQGSHQRVLEGNTKLSIGLDRQPSFHKQLSGVQPWHDNDVRSASQSVGSRQTASDYGKDKKRIIKQKSSGSLYRSSSLKEKEELLIGGVDFAETIINQIASEPIHVMAKRFHQITEHSIACLKETVGEIMLKADKHGQLCAFQQVLQNRSDITFEMLIKSHRAQLEIMVALKTGLKEYLQRNYSTSPSDLAEIFLNLRCRNVSCRSPLPVDECDCKFCVQKNGFCSACMCLICSKFDMASNTCSWVGCDVCQHWCHTDCALRESYIRSGCSVNGPDGTSEMQFHCVACKHPSEMFGFVKEVFQNFAKDWSAETLSRELEYVKRIFYASKDLRGSQLHDFIDQMQARLANKSNLPEVYNYIMGFLTGGESSNLGNTPTFFRKELPKKNHEGSNGVGGLRQEDMWLKSVHQESAPHPQLERSASLLPYFDNKRNDKRTVEPGPELPRNAPKEQPVFDELESIVRIKQAEASMFQARADDARREAEGLKRIAVAKNEKTEEEYTSRIAKLRLVEAEEMRKQKLEELQVLERAHREYFNMKVRMEADIKDLLLKMEATRCNLAI